jgi:hypothetical protein
VKHLRSLIMVAAAVALALPASAAAGYPPGPWYASWAPLCQSRASLCSDSSAPLDGQYVGHDEPSVLFKSNIPGSGNDVTWYYRLSTNPTQWRRRDDVELRASRDRLVRDGGVRLAVRP